jgi:four helix bundle protein
MSKNILLEKSFIFSVKIVKLCRYLTETKKEFVLSKQLLRSGTAIGALIREAQNAESTKDFIHKLAIAQKECDETIYWLELLKETEYIDQIEFENIQCIAIELLKMLRSSIITMKQKLISNNL